MKVQVLGPAYLDRVLHVDRRLSDPPDGPLDLSVSGRLESGGGLTLVDPDSRRLLIQPPAGWPGPLGTIHLADAIASGPGGTTRPVAGVSWHDDLGGMGAGYAAALGGELTSALGAGDDPVSRAVSRLLDQAGIVHHPLRPPGPDADWTLLVTSGAHGDKLPIGFRGCHDAVRQLPALGPCDLRVVASFPNRLAAEALRAPGARLRLFAPAWRNVVDRSLPIEDLADSIDILACNRREWEAIGATETLRERLALLSITDGERGATIWYRPDDGPLKPLHQPAMPRYAPPRDTNRAGEAFAATLVAALREGGWTPRPGCSEALVRRAGQRASAAAALVLDRERFGFPTARQIDQACRAGFVAGVRRVEGAPEVLG